MNLHREENENEEQFLWRLGQLKDNGTFDGDWDDIADSRVGAHYNNIGLQYPYRRPRAKAAINGMMEVAAELLDTKIENGVYDDDVFMMTDFSSIFTKEVPRPEFIE